MYCTKKHKSNETYMHTDTRTHTCHSAVAVFSLYLLRGESSARRSITSRLQLISPSPPLSFSSYSSITTSLTSQYVVFSIYGWRHLTYIIAADSHIHLWPQTQTHAGESNTPSQEKGKDLQLKKAIILFIIMHFKGQLKRFSECLILKWTNLMKKTLLVFMFL